MISAFILPKLNLANEKDLGKVEFTEETVPGRKSWRHRELSRMLESMEAGDSLFLSELSRFGR